MTVRDTIARMSKSEWPPSPTSVLKAVLGLVAVVIVSATSWLLLSHVTSLQVQAQNSQAIQATQAAVTDTTKNVERLGKHDEKIDEAIHGINLTTQRLSDMLARHDADIDEIKDDLKDERRRRRSNR